MNQVRPGLAGQMFSLDGQVALVTGAKRGLGLEMARALSSAGAHVILAGRSEVQLADAVARIEADGGAASPLAFDLDDAAQTSAAVSRINERHGRLDVLVANAGIRNRTGFAALDPASFARVLQTNLVATTDLALQAARMMVAGGRSGRIILIGSLISSLAAADDPAYLASKAALTGMTLALAAEFGPHGITANEIAPGPFATEYNAALAQDEHATEMVRSRTLLRRWGQPEEIAAAALFLASPGAAFVTGHRLLVDGGMSVKA